jgi:hypothetical protein
MKFLYFLVLFFALTASATEQEIEQFERDYIKNSGLDLKASCVMSEYFKNMRPLEYRSASAVGDGNAGFSKMMNQRYFESKCFRVALDKFYKEVDKFDELTRVKRSSALTSQLKPSINSGVDQLNVPGVKAGWMLEAAQKIAGGDPAFALQILSFCGHDDVSQMNTPKSEKKSNTNPNSSSTTNKVRIECPRPSSLIYFPDSLGLGARTPPEAIQVLTANRTVDRNTPAKNYHVTTSAFLGCQLRENCNVSAEESARYQRYASYMYRSVRLKFEANRLKSKYKTEFDYYLKNDESLGGIRNVTKLESLIFEKLKKDNLQFNQDKRKSEQALKEKSKTEAHKLISLYLYDESNGVLSTLAKVTDEMDVTKQNYVFDKDSAKFKDLCRKIAGSQCASAQSTLNNWNADFVWTMSQHSVGANLGNKLCKDSKQQRAGGRPSVCENYEKEPDLTDANMTRRGHQESEKEISSDNNGQTIKSSSSISAPSAK